MNEIEILNKEVGGIKIKDMTTITFYQVVAKRLDGVKTFSPVAVELTTLVGSPVATRQLPNDYKLDIIRKLKSINIEF